MQVVSVINNFFVQISVFGGRVCVYVCVCVWNKNMVQNKTLIYSLTQRMYSLVNKIHIQIYTYTHIHSHAHTHAQQTLKRYSKKNKIK